MFNFLQSLDPFFVSFIELGVYCLIILCLFKFMGKVGIYLFIAVAIIGANLQVLKVSYFGFFKGGVALGTALFATIFFCTDILSEHYGKKTARTAVGIGFGAFFVWSVITQFTLGYSPLTPEQAGQDFAWGLSIHPALETIFTLVPSFFLASVIAYFISQMTDIYLFELIKKKTKSRFLFLRNNLSTMVSSLVDNIIFSVIAFKVLNPEPVEMKTLIFTFILGTYLLRVFFSLFDTPFIYLSYYFLPKDLKDLKDLKNRKDTQGNSSS